MPHGLVSYCGKANRDHSDFDMNSKKIETEKSYFVILLTIAFDFVIPDPGMKHFW